MNSLLTSLIPSFLLAQVKSESATPETSTEKKDDDDWISIPLKKDIFTLSTRSPVIDSKGVHNTILSNPFNQTSALTRDSAEFSTGTAIAGTALYRLIKHVEIRDKALMRLAVSILEKREINDSIAKQLKSRGIKIDNSVKNAVEEIGNRISNTSYKQQLSKTTNQILSPSLIEGADGTAVPTRKPAIDRTSTIQKTTQKEVVNEALDELKGFVDDLDSTPKILKNLKKGAKAGLGKAKNYLGENKYRLGGAGLGLGMMIHGLYQGAVDINEGLSEPTISAKIEYDATKPNELTLNLKNLEGNPTTMHFRKDGDGNFKFYNTYPPEKSWLSISSYVDINDKEENATNIHKDEIKQFLEPVLKNQSANPQLATIIQFFGLTEASTTPSPKENVTQTNQNTTAIPQTPVEPKAITYDGTNGTLESLIRNYQGTNPSLTKLIINDIVTALQNDNTTDTVITFFNTGNPDDIAKLITPNDKLKHATIKSILLGLRAEVLSKARQ